MLNLTSSKRISKIVIGNDHAAYDMKLMIVDYLKKYDIPIDDQGCHSLKSCDYPDYAHLVCSEVLKDNNALGILICGSGVGISIAANKIRGIRCGLAHDHYTSQMARVKDHCNVVAFGARVVGSEIAKQIVDIFLQSEPSQEESYLHRVELIKQLEDKQYNQQSK